MLKQVRELVSPPRIVRRVFYGWWLVGVAAVILAVGNAPLFQALTVWFPVLERAFGWRRAQLSVAFALTRAEATVVGPLAGYLNDNLGPRRMVLIGLLILGAGFLLLSRVQELWHLYGAFMVMSIGAGLGTWLTVMTALNNWFVQRRSTAIAWAMEGYYIGGILIVPAMAWAMDPDHPDRFGWRATAAGIGVIIMLLALPLSSLVRNRPEEYGDQADGREAVPVASGTTEPQRPASGEGPEYTWQDALRTRSFWVITMGHASCSVVIVTITVHLGSLLNIDREFSLQTVGWVVSTFVAVAAVFTIVGGYVGDRVPVRLVIFWFSAIQAASVVVLLLAHSTYMVFLFAVILGIGFGGRNPLTTSIRGTYFGRRAFARITGMSIVPINVFSMAFPFFTGYMRDIRGNYTVPFITLAVTGFIGAALFLLLGEPQRSASSPRATPAMDR